MATKVMLSNGTTVLLYPLKETEATEAIDARGAYHYTHLI